MNVSMWNTILGWNGWNKSESYMAVIIKVNPIHIGSFQGSQKIRVGRGYEKAYVDVREIRLGNKVWKKWKSIKIEHQFNQIALTSTVIFKNF